ncbi:IS30 family transposase [Eubacteriales bacterium OttesenSCG-928-A19]|nr:IS30 family transposase [Eubacteriales bacterium OttesenSCG-928-A19]
MEGYKHLTWHDRLRIDKMIREGRKQNEIAAALHVHESTISRELRRATYAHTNSDLTEEVRYNPEGAQARYDTNKTAKGAPLKIGNDHKLAEYIETKIADEKYSPCAVLAEIENEGLQFSVTICRATLYKYIDEEVFLRITNKDLPFRGKRRAHKTKHVRAARAPRGESIEKRPDHINDRSEFGHWEMDLVDGRRGSRSNVLVLTERQTRQEHTRKVPDKTDESVVAALDELERKYGQHFKEVFKSITIDNGSEFADCAGMERSIYGGQRTKCYYCHPRNPQERGSNEKQNQMIRRHLPKGTNFDEVPDSELERITDWLNRYPRKLFDWACSQDLFNLALSAICCGV